MNFIFSVLVMLILLGLAFAVEMTGEVYVLAYSW